MESFILCHSYVSFVFSTADTKNKVFSGIIQSNSSAATVCSVVGAFLPMAM